MGRNAGYIALNVAIASGAMAVLLPEKEFDMHRDILDKIAETQKTGKTIQDADKMEFQTDEFYVKTTDEMYELFSTETVNVRHSCVG